MTPSYLLKLFREKEALKEGHFRLSSGLHSRTYLQCALILQYPNLAARLGKALARRVREAGHSPDLVVSPALGGMIIGHETARALERRFLFVERADGEFRLRRGLEIHRGESVLIVEDVITTGLSTLETIREVQRHEGVPCAVAAVADRSCGKADLGLWTTALLHLNVESWAPEDCPQCRAGVPVVKPGSRP